jgi:hypothetical protein
MHAAERRAAVDRNRGRGPAAPYYYDDYDDYRPYPAARGHAPAQAGRVPARRPAPMGYSVRSGRADVRRRRQNVLFGLLAAAAVTALGGFGLGISALIAVHLLIDALLVFYVYLLVQLRRAEEQRAMRYAWSKAA